MFKPSSSKPTPKPQPGQTPKSQPRQTPKSQPRSTSSSKYKPPIKPQPKPTPKPQPKPSPKPQPKPKPKQGSRVGDLQPIFIKIDNSNCSELTQEFKEWNGKLLLVKTDKESKDIQKILSRIGKVRMDKNC